MEKKMGYRLVDVLTLEGISKAQENELYRERIGWVSDYIRKSRRNDSYYIYFSETSDGRWASERIHTTDVSEVVETEDSLKLYTMNSIYVFDEYDVVSMDLVEYNPLHDQDGKTAAMIVEIVEYVKERLLTKKREM